MKKLYLLLAIVFVIGLMLGCDSPKEDSIVCTDPVTCNSVSEIPNEAPVKVSDDVEKIEAYHFHGTNQCFSCRTVGAFAEKTVNTYYKDLLDSGKITFASINVELAENKELTVKYGATGSSLWIGTYINGEFHKEEDTNVWYKIRDEQGYLDYLKSVLDKRLSGDLS